VRGFVELVCLSCTIVLRELVGGDTNKGGKCVWSARVLSGASTHGWNRGLCFFLAFYFLSYPTVETAGYNFCFVFILRRLTCASTGGLHRPAIAGRPLGAFVLFAFNVSDRVAYRGLHPRLLDVTLSGLCVSCLCCVFKCIGLLWVLDRVAYRGLHPRLLDVTLSGLCVSCLCCVFKCIGLSVWPCCVPRVSPPAIGCHPFRALCFVLVFVFLSAYVYCEWLKFMPWSS